MQTYNIKFDKNKLDELEVLALQDIYEFKMTINEFNAKYGTELKRFLSLRIYTNDVCESCGKALRVRMVAKTDIGNINKLKLYCECGHTADLNCTCETCVKIKEDENMINKISKLEELTEIENSKDELTFEEIDYRFYIAISYIYDSFGMNEFYMGDEKIVKMYFDNYYLLLVIRKLYEDDILKMIVKEDNYENYNVNNDSVSYIENEMFYKLNISEDNILKMIDKIKNDFSYEHIVEKTFKVISISYLTLYFTDRLKAQKLNYISNDIEYIRSIRSSLADLLDDFSVSFLLKSLYYSVNKASNFKIEYGVDDLKVEKAIKTNLKNSLNVYSKDTGFDEVIYFEECSILNFINKEIIKTDKYWFTTDLTSILDDFHLEEKAIMREKEELSNLELQKQYEKNLINQRQLDEIKNFMKNVEEKFDEIYYSYINFKDNMIPKDFIKNHLGLNNDALDFIDGIIKDNLDITSEDKLAFLKEFNLI